MDLMHRKTFPKALFLLIVSAFFSVSALIGQDKAETELVVSKCWSYGIGAAEFVVDGSGFYAGGVEGKIEAISLDGQKLWTTDLGGKLVSNLLVGNEALYLVTSTPFGGDKGNTGGNTLRVLSKETGIPRTGLRLPEADRHFLKEFHGSIVVVSSSGVVQLLDVKDGSTKWRREIAEGFTGDPSFGSDAVLMASTSNQLFIISLVTGEIRSMRKNDTGTRAAAELSSGELIIGDGRGSVSFFPDGNDGVLWRYKAGGAITALLPINGHLLVASNDNFIYYLSMPRGGLAWKKRFAGRVSYYGILETSLALISSIEEHGAIFVRLETGKTVGQIVLEANEFLVANPIFANGQIIVLTNNRVIAYSLNGCAADKDGGSDQTPAPPPQKN